MGHCARERDRLKQTSIDEVYRRISILSRQQKIWHLRGLIASSKNRQRKADLQAILKPILNSQITWEIRQDKRLPPLTKEQDGRLVAWINENIDPADLADAQIAERK